SDASGNEWPVAVVVYATSTTPGAGTFQFVGTANGLPVIVESGSITVNAGTNLNTSSLALETGGNLATIASRTPALGQALAAASVPVVLTAAQITTLTPLSTVASTQSGTWNVAVNTALPAGTNVIGHVIVDSGSITATGSGNFTVVQSTASSLNATVVGTG